MNDLVVMLTALELEYRAARATLTDVRLRRHPAGTRFEVGRLLNGKGQVALALAGKGNHPAAVLAERAIADFDPAALLFVGIAGALWPMIELGDVVVATHVYAYHGGTSQDDGLKARPRTWEIPHGPDQIARHLARSGTWARGLPHGLAVPTVHFGPIAAGEIVQDSATSNQARWIREHYNDALAIEMEAAGVAQAGHLNNSRPVIVIRGISDRADGTKTSTDGVGWQQRAAVGAAAFGAALAGELVLDGNEAHPDLRQAAWSQQPGQESTNIATGHAHVGVQAGQIFGNIHIGPGPGAAVSLATHVADFGKRLRLAHEAGQLDASTYEAASAELAVVRKSLTAGAGQNAGKLMAALKKLRGLIANTAELAAHLAVIISAAKGLS